MPQTFFTSDCHLGHANILTYCNRPFKDVYEMNKKLIENWNSRVKPNDIIYILGDFYFHKSKKGNGLNHNFSYYNEKLNGYKVFVRGNHEHSNDIHSKITALVLEFGGLEIYCCHRPEDFHPVYKLNLVGHVHNEWVTKKQDGSVLINVGVDVWNYAPVKANELLDLYNKVIK